MTEPNKQLSPAVVNISRAWDAQIGQLEQMSSSLRLLPLEQNIQYQQWTASYCNGLDTFVIVQLPPIYGVPPCAETKGRSTESQSTIPLKRSLKHIDNQDSVLRPTPTTTKEAAPPRKLILINTNKKMITTSGLQVTNFVSEHFINHLSYPTMEALCFVTNMHN